MFFLRMMEHPPALVTPEDAEAANHGEVAQDEQNSTPDGDGKYGGEGGLKPPLLSGR
jgi:hypothetical protein